MRGTPPDNIPRRHILSLIVGGLTLFVVASAARAQQGDGTLRGHEGAILMGVFTPDGQRAVTASTDQTARLWDLKSGLVLRPFDQHTGPLYCLGVSQSGSTLVTGSQDNTLRVWDLPPLVAAESLPLLPMTVRCLQLHPDGNRMLVGAADKSFSIHTLAPATGNPGPVAPPEIRAGHTGEVLAIGCRNDGVAYASADSTGQIILWNPFLPGPQRTLRGGDSRVNAVRFPANNQQLVTSGDDGVIRVWQLAAAAPRSLPAFAAEVVKIDLLTNQTQAVIVLADHTAAVINLADDTVARHFAAVPYAIREVTHAPDNSWMAFGGETGTVALVNPVDGTSRGQTIGHLGAVTDLASLSDNLQFVTAGMDGTIRQWQLPQAETVAAGHTAPTRGVVASPNGQWFATISDDKTTRLWDSQGGALRQMGAHEQPLRAVAVRDDAALLATGDLGGDVWLWNPADGSPQGVVAAHPGGVTALTFSTDRAQLITTGADQKVRAWKLPLPAKKPGEGEPPPQPVWEYLIPGGRLATSLVTLAADQGYAGVQGGVGELLRLKPDGTAVTPAPAAARPLKSLSVSGDGQQWLGVDDQGLATVWSAQGALVRTLPLGVNVSTARFKPDGTALIVADALPRVRICDAVTGLTQEEITTSIPLTDAIWVAAEFTQLAGVGDAVHPIVIRRALRRIFAEAPVPNTPPAVPVPIMQLAVVGDQQHLLAARQNGAIEQWRITDGSLVRRFDTGAVTMVDLALTANGQLVAGIGADQKLRLWNWSDGLLAKTIELGVAATSLTLSPDNTRAATAHTDGKIRVWGIPGGQLLETLEGHQGAASCARFLSDSRTLITGSADKTVRVATSTALQGFAVSPGPLPPSVLYNGGTHAITGRNASEVVMLDLSTGAETRVFRVKLPMPALAAAINPGEAVPVTYTAFQPTAVASRVDNQRVAAGTKTGELYLWNANNGDELMATFALAAPVSAVAFSADNQKLAAATADGRVRIYGPSIPGVQPPREWTLWQETQMATPVTDLAFSADSQSFWAGLENGATERWPVAAPGPIRQYNHGGPVYGVAINGSGKVVVSCSTDQTVRVWDNVTGQQKFQLNGHEGAVHAVAMSRDETFAISSGADGTLRLWDIVGGRQLKELVRYSSTMYSVAIHPQGQFIAAAGADRKVHLLDMIAGTEVRTLTGHTDYIHSVQFSPDGTKLVSYGYAGHLKVWRTADGVLLHESRQGQIGNYAAFSPDGMQLLLSGGDGLARTIVAP